MTTEELNALIVQAESGDVAAMNQLGQIYGGNEFEDFEKAFYWHKKAAELGNVNSMSNLGGWCYLWGNGTEKNLKLAVDWRKL